MDSPERYKVELSELRDYPPRIILDLMPPAPFSPPANLVVQGLKEPCSFTILTPVKGRSLRIARIMQHFIFCYQIHPRHHNAKDHQHDVRRK